MLCVTYPISIPSTTYDGRSGIFMMRGQAGLDPTNAEGGLAMTKPRWIGARFQVAGSREDSRACIRPIVIHRRRGQVSLNGMFNEYEYYPSAYDRWIWRHVR